jgi:diguanylate cyclase (GGDEF)-like protein
MGYQQFSVILKDEIERSFSEQHPMALALFSIDRLKDMGDTYGQQFCELVIKEIGRKLGISIRGTDSAGRFSSEEFGLILTKTDPSLLDKTGERIRKRLMEITIKSPRGEEIRPVLSCGIALCNEKIATLDALVKATGDSLSHARQHGDRVEIYSS